MTDFEWTFFERFPLKWKSDKWVRLDVGCEKTHFNWKRLRAPWRVSFINSNFYGLPFVQHSALSLMKCKSLTVNCLFVIKYIYIIRVKVYLTPFYLSVIEMEKLRRKKKISSEDIPSIKRWCFTSIWRRLFWLLLNAHTNRYFIFILKLHRNTEPQRILRHWISIYALA